MKTITVGFSKPKNKVFPVFSWLIRLYQRTEYSHVYLKFYSKTLERTLIYEAVGKEIRFVGVNKWKHSAEEVKSHSISISDDSFLEIMKFCVDEAGGDYGYMQNIGIFISDILNLNHNMFKSGKNCSEVLGRILHKDGYIFEKEFDLLTPEDIDKALKRGKVAV